MFSIGSLSAGIPKFIFGHKSGGTSFKVDVPPVQVHEVEENREKRARTVNQLIKANHVNFSVLSHDNKFHNHTPHILGSAYILGASHAQLNSIYDSQVPHHEAWAPAPGEISKDDWREYLGKPEYQRAFLDYFEDQLIQNGYDWKAVLEEVLNQGSEPLMNNLLAGLGHPLIHLGYAYELSSQAVAMEALTLTACCYNNQHKFLDSPSYTKPSTFHSTSLLDILEKARNDRRFDETFTSHDVDDPAILLQTPDQEALLLEYWNTWKIQDPKRQFEQSQQTAVALLVGTPKGSNPKYDFFLVHLLTTSHALRIIMPIVSAKWHLPLLRQWWLFVLSTYIARSRPKVDLERITGYDRGRRDWDTVVDGALNSDSSKDEHFVKGCRAMKEAANVWGDADEYYLSAALRFVDEFDGDWVF